MRNVFLRAGKKVVYAEHFVTRLQQTLAQVRAEEADSPGD
jgi:hypothetical protein